MILIARLHHSVCVLTLLIDSAVLTVGERLGEEVEKKGVFHGNYVRNCVSQLSVNLLGEVSCQKICIGINYRFYICNDFFIHWFFYQHA